jgi:hypothetical protein
MNKGSIHIELHREMDKVDTCGIHRQIKLNKKQSET